MRLDYHILLKLHSLPLLAGSAPVLGLALDFR